MLFHSSKIMGFLQNVWFDNIFSFPGVNCAPKWNKSLKLRVSLVLMKMKKDC